MQPPALYHQAQADLRAGRPAQAVEALQSCVTRHPDFAPAFLALADLVGPAQPNIALQLLIHALDRFPDHRGPVTRALAAILPGLHPKAWHPGLERALLACFDDPQPLARFAARLLLRKHPETDLVSAEKDPLWHAFLSRCINVDPVMEGRIHQLRQAAEPTSPLTPALALHAFANEYVAAPLASPEPLLALLNAPLIDLPHLALPPGNAWSELTRRTRDDLLEERRLAAALPSLAPLSNATSHAVAAQYEANPYPRWHAPPAPAPRDLRTFLRGFGVEPSDAPAVLVAGCGTGYEAIDLARTDPNVSVTALDLSRASLAYAQRMANALGVLNLRFIQGDILDLAMLDQRFDFITSTGVLHHMANPGEGLTALISVTRPGALLRLSLYSHYARAPIRAAHQLIRQRGWKPTPEGIRTFRDHVLELPAGTPLARLRDSDDFYTLSGCRDLVFHVCEHQFTLPQIRTLLGDLHLVGFDAPPSARSLFGDADPLDLDRWDRLEQQHPTLFAGMYQLLVRAPVGA